MRRELPEGRETVWASSLYDVSRGATLPGTVLDGIGDHPEFVLDTLSVNKLYRRDFLVRHAIRFPDGAFHYEDFVFSARVQAAEPRLAVTDVPVYVWHVRRQAATLSISLRRASLANWEHRIAAHAAVVEVFARRPGPPSPSPRRRSSSTTTSPCTCASCRSGPTPTGPAGGRRPAPTSPGSTPPRSPPPGRRPAGCTPGSRRSPPYPRGGAEPVRRAGGPRPRLVPPYPTAGDGTPVLAAAPADVPLDGLAELAPAGCPSPWTAR